MLRWLLLLVVVSSLAFTSAAGADPTTNAGPRHAATAAPPETVRPVSSTLGGGESWEDATTIPGLPFADSSSTCGHTHDVELTCDGAGLAADLVYRLTTPSTGYIDISLCGSGYNTALAFFDSLRVERRCDNDGCGLQSMLGSVPVAAGRSYYIVVSGADSACGDYRLSVGYAATNPCVVTCPPRATRENEPDCYDNYYDYTNGGCNSTGWTDLCPQHADTAVAFGTSGTFYYGDYSYRDTDWYVTTVTPDYGDPVRITETVTAEFQPSVILVYSDSRLINCTNYTYVYSTGPACVPVSVSAMVHSEYYVRRFWPWVGTMAFGYGVPCGSNYVMTVTGAVCAPAATENATWGKVKGLFR